MPTEEFRAWNDWGGEGEGDKAVLFFVIEVWGWEDIYRVTITILRGEKKQIQG